MLPKAWTSGGRRGGAVYANKQSYMNNSISYIQCLFYCVFDVGCCHWILRLMQAFLAIKLPSSGT